MKAHIDKHHNIKRTSFNNNTSSTLSNKNPTLSFEDNRAESIAQRKLQEAINSGSCQNVLSGEHNLPSIQRVKKGGKQQAGMPKKSKAGSKEKQQSKAQRTYNAFQSYRGDFVIDNGVTVQHVNQYLKEGNTLHGHGSSSASKDSGENQATKDDADQFVGWFRKRYLNKE